MSGHVGDPGFSAPDFDEVNVYQRGTSIQSVYESGKFSVKRSETITVVLHPKKTGDLKIRELKILVNNKVISHPDITISVYEEGKMPAGSSRGHLFGGARQQQKGLQAPLPRSGVGTARQDVAKSILIRTEPDKVKVYKGQLIRLKYSLYTRAQLANMQVERFPTATGFLKEDIDVPVLKGLQNLDWTRAVLGGVEYRKGTLAEYALFPVREGQLPLDVFSAKVSFRGRSGISAFDDDMGDPLNLNRFFQAFQLLTETIESDRRNIEVLPLPTEGQPVDFSGLVGTFSVDIQTDKSTLKTGEPLQVKIRIAGEGHAGSLEKLDVAWPESFEMYEDRSSTKFDISGRSERVFEYLLIPRKVGDFTIPAVQVWMFDPESKSYAARQTTAVAIRVEQGNESSGGLSVVKSSGVNTRKQQQAKKEMAAIFKDDQLGPKVDTKRARPWRWLPLLSLTLILLVAGLLWLKPSKFIAWASQIKTRRQTAPIVRYQRLESLINTSQPEKFLVQLDNDLTKVLLQRYGLTRGSMTTSELLHAMQDKGLATEITQSVKVLAERLESMRFASEQRAVKTEDLKQLLELFKLVVEAR
jgi:hypothetical protein